MNSGGAGSSSPGARPAGSSAGGGDTRRSDGRRFHVLRGTVSVTCDFDRIPTTDDSAGMIGGFTTTDTQPLRPTTSRAPDGADTALATLPSAIGQL